MEPTPITMQPLPSSEPTEKKFETLSESDKTPSELTEVTAVFQPDDGLNEENEEAKEKKRQLREEATSGCCCDYVADDDDAFCLYICCHWIMDCFRCIGECTDSCFEDCASCLGSCCEDSGNVDSGNGDVGCLDSCCSCDDGGDVGGDCDGCFSCDCDCSS